MVESLKLKLKAKDEELTKLRDTASDHDHRGLLEVPRSKGPRPTIRLLESVDVLNRKVSAAAMEEDLWTVKVERIVDGVGGPMSLERARAVFAEFDVDGGGSIDAAELQLALRRMDRDLSAEEVEGIMAEIDANGDGVIDFEEFQVMVGTSWFIDCYKTKMARATAKALAEMMRDDVDGGDDAEWSPMAMDSDCDDEKERERTSTESEAERARLTQIRSSSERVVAALRAELAASESKREALAEALDKMGRAVRSKEVCAEPAVEEKEESDCGHDGGGHAHSSSMSLRRELERVRLERDTMALSVEAERAKMESLRKQMVLSTACGQSAAAELPEMVRKYRKHRGRSESKTQHHRRRLLRHSSDLLDALQREHDAFLVELEAEDRGLDATERELFGAVFLRMSRFLYFVRFLGLTLSAFEGEIEEMLSGDIGPSTLSLCHSVLHRVWRQIYGEEFDFVVVEVDSDKWGAFRFEGGLCAFCTKSSQFMAGCYRWNYAEFGRNVARSLCPLLLEQQEVAEREDVAAIVDRLIVATTNILDDRRRFVLMLWKSMMNRHRGDGHDHDHGHKSPSTPHHSSYHEMVSGSDHSLSDEEERECLFEKVLSLIIVNVVDLRMDGRHHRNHPLPAEALHLIDCKMQIVLKQCGRWRVDEKSKAMIHRFFVYHFKGSSPEFTGTCGSGNGCILQ